MTNPVVWFEIYVEDMARAVAFYEHVFETSLSRMEMPEGVPGAMSSFPGSEDSPGAASGALVHMEGMAPGGGGTLVYFQADDCAVPTARVAAAGGSVVQEKSSIGHHGFISLVRDTEGNLIGVHSLR